MFVSTTYTMSAIMSILIVIIENKLRLQFITRSHYKQHVIVKLLCKMYPAALLSLLLHHKLYPFLGMLCCLAGDIVLEIADIDGAKLASVYFGTSFYMWSLQIINYYIMYNVLYLFVLIMIVTVFIIRLITHGTPDCCHPCLIYYGAGLSLFVSTSYYTCNSMLINACCFYLSDIMTGCGLYCKSNTCSIIGLILYWTSIWNIYSWFLQN